MALANFDDWVPEEWGGDVISAQQRSSLVMSLGRHEPMTTGDTKHVPRVGEMEVTNTGKGEAYAEDSTTNDDVVLTARKLTGGVAIAEEDMRDTATYVSIENAKKTSWATSMAKAFDNATLGVTAAESATASNGRPFQSVYHLIRTTDSGLSYTADDNLTLSATSGGITYADLSNAAADYEDGSYFDEDNTIVIASPAFRNKLRQIVDGQDRPIFMDSAKVDVATMSPAGAGTRSTNFTLFGYPLFFSQGCRTSATMSKAPTGNPLLIICNRLALINGDKWPMESLLIPPNISKEDEAFLKMRYRGGFAGGHPAAFSVLEARS